MVVDVRPGGEDFDRRESGGRHRLEMRGAKRLGVEQVRGEAEVHGQSVRKREERRKGEPRKAAKGLPFAISFLPPSRSSQLVAVRGEQVVQPTEGAVPGQVVAHVTQFLGMYWMYTGFCLAVVW